MFFVCINWCAVFCCAFVYAIALLYLDVLFCRVLIYVLCCVMLCLGVLGGDSTFQLVLIGWSVLLVSMQGIARRGVHGVG